MVKDLRSDPIFEKKTSPFRAAEKRKKDFSSEYQKLINGIIVFRSTIAAPVAVLLILLFSRFDFIFYPAQAPLFLKIRITEAILITLALLFGIWKKRWMIWCIDAILFSSAAAACLMIYLTNGASSHYYEGINLIILGLLVVNGFYVWHNLIICFLILVCYSLAAVLNSAGWDFMKFYFALYFMGSTAFFVVLMTKFYSNQHLSAFLNNQQLKEDERQLEILYGMAEEKSKIDDLTKIYNRRYFFEILSKKMKLSKISGEGFYLIIFDIDHFKKVNDTYGHIFGDQVIATVAATVHKMMRVNSYLGRFGGDEFMLLLDEATPEEFFSRLQTISRAIRSLEIYYDFKKLELTASFGAAHFSPSENMDEKRLIELADNALFEVKRTCRGEIKLIN